MMQSAPISRPIGRCEPAFRARYPWIRVLLHDECGRDAVAGHMIPFRFAADGGSSNDSPNRKDRPYEDGLRLSNEAEPVLRFEVLYLALKILRHPGKFLSASRDLLR